MNDKPRLTKKKEEFEYEFCAECVNAGEPRGCNRKEGACDAYSMFTGFANRLQEFEDAIESGELVPVVRGEWVVDECDAADREVGI